jgi:hypothetical protein
MNIALASCFVNSTPTLPRYLAQVVALHDALAERGDRLTCLWGEGDSTDETRRTLEAMRWRLNSRVIDVTHGGPIFGSVVRAERFRQLAGVGRKIWAALPGDAEVVLWVESDLVWSIETALGLIDLIGRVTTMVGNRLIPAINPSTRAGHIRAVAPPIILHRSGWPQNTWYDTAFFRCQGRNFEHHPPYHPANTGDGLLEMERVGSMVAFDANALRHAAATYDERVLGGLCDDIRKIGGRVWYAPFLPPAIHH